MEKVRFTPLYLQVKEAIFERVLAGEWPPGTFLPNEFLLADQYGVSQGTLRKALEELTLEKHLIRYQGKGTTVADFNKSNSVFPFYMIYDKSDTRLYPLTKTIYHELIVPPKHVTAKLQLKAKDEVIFAERLRPLDEEQEINVLREMVYIPKKHFSKASLENLTTMPDRLYSYYITSFGKRVCDAVEEISAVLADELDAKYLNVQEKTPILLIQRTSYSVNKEPIEYREYKIDTSLYSYKSIII